MVLACDAMHGGKICPSTMGMDGKVGAGQGAPLHDAAPTEPRDMVTRFLLPGLRWAFSAVAAFEACHWSEGLSRTDLGASVNLASLAFPQNECQRATLQAITIQTLSQLAPHAADGATHLKSAPQRLENIWVILRNLQAASQGARRKEQLAHTLFRA